MSLKSSSSKKEVNKWKTGGYLRFGRHSVVPMQDLCKFHLQMQKRITTINIPSSGIFAIRVTNQRHLQIFQIHAPSSWIVIYWLLQEETTLRPVSLATLVAIQQFIRTHSITNNGHWIEGNFWIFHLFQMVLSTLEIECVRLKLKCFPIFLSAGSSGRINRSDLLIIHCLLIPINMNVHTFILYSQK